MNGVADPLVFTSVVEGSKISGQVFCPERITPWKRKHHHVLNGPRSRCGQTGGEEYQSTALYLRK